MGLELAQGRTRNIFDSLWQDSAMCEQRGNVGRVVSETRKWQICIGMSPHMPHQRSGSWLQIGLLEFKRLWLFLLWTAVSSSGFFSRAADSNNVINPPIGPYVNLQPAAFAGAVSFNSDDRVVFTPYFYWYDVYSGAHITDFDGTDALTDHPPTMTGFSYLS